MNHIFASYEFSNLQLINCNTVIIIVHRTFVHSADKNNLYSILRTVPGISVNSHFITISTIIIFTYFLKTLKSMLVTSSDDTRRAITGSPVEEVLLASVNCKSYCRPPGRTETIAKPERANFCWTVTLDYLQMGCMCVLTPHW